MLHHIITAIMSVIIAPWAWFSQPVSLPVIPQRPLSIVETPLSVKPLTSKEFFGGPTTIKFVSGTKYRLAGSGVAATDVSITLQSLTFPVSGTELSMTDFGSIGYATLEPNTSKKELISFTGLSQDATSTQATLSGVVRGLNFNAPYDQNTSLRQTHSGGAVIVFSDPPQLFNRLAAKDNDEDIFGRWRFSSTSIPILDAAVTATSSDQFITKRYADNLVNQGAATSTEANGGIVQLGTNEQSANSFNGGAGQPTVLQTKNATSSPGSATQYSTVITNRFGKIDPKFLGGVATSTSFNATTTHTGIETGYLTASSTIQFGGTAFNTPQSTSITATSTLKLKGGSTTSPLTGIFEQASWEELGEFTAQAATSSLVVGNLPAREELKITLHIVGTNSVTGDQFIRFNGDDASNYGSRHFINLIQERASPGPASPGELYLDINSGSTTQRYFTFYVENRSGSPKLVNWTGTAISGATNVNPPNQLRGSGTWNNTSSQISLIMVKNDNDTATTFNAGSRLTIYGKRN